MGCNNTKVENEVKEPVRSAPEPTPTDSRLPLTAREVFRLQKSWKGIKRKMDETGTEMFIRLFRSNAGLKKLFTQFQGIDCEEKMRIDETFASHGALVLAAIDDIISRIDDVDGVIKTCEELRRTHSGFTGFLAPTFWNMEQPFLDAVRLSLDTAFSEQIEAIYKKAIRFIMQNLTGTSEPCLTNGSINVVHVAS